MDQSDGYTKIMDIIKKVRLVSLWMHVTKCGPPRTSLGKKIDSFNARVGGIS